MSERIDQAVFRGVLGHLPTGVTVVTARSTDGPVGMAANSVTSLSLDPPLVLFCPARSSTTWPQIRTAGGFCINIMARHHEQMSRQFSVRNAERFAGVDLIERHGQPALRDAIAWVDCRVHAELDGGDHVIVVADVIDLEATTIGQPLVFFRGGYGGFAPAS
ncbi:MAG: flavin reductase family protein [Microbacterium sp.]|uniref:flavin reductase family protein n=1 Tax=Microbacterium sp. TaxID=51671 RepID=UPI0039E67993